MRVMNERAVFERIRLLGPYLARSSPRRPGCRAEPSRWRSRISLDVVWSGTSGSAPGTAVGRALLYEMRPERVGGRVDVGARGCEWRSRTSPASSCSGGRSDRSPHAKKLVAQIGGVVSALSSEAGLSYEDVTYTVIGSPGVVDERSGAMRLAANLSGWNGPGVLDALREQLGPRSRSRTTSTWRRSANKRTGSARASRLRLRLGRDRYRHGHRHRRQLHRGARGAAGEIGFLPLGEAEVANEETSKRRRGSLESVASADRGRRQRAPVSGMRGVLTAKQVFEATRDQRTRSR